MQREIRRLAVEVIRFFGTQKEIARLYISYIGKERTKKYSSAVEYTMRLNNGCFDIKKQPENLHLKLLPSKNLQQETITVLSELTGA